VVRATACENVSPRRNWPMAQSPRTRCRPAGIEFAAERRNWLLRGGLVDCNDKNGNALHATEAACGVANARNS